MSTLTARQGASRTRTASAPTVGTLARQLTSLRQSIDRAAVIVSDWLERLGEARRRRRAFRRSLRELEVLSDRTLGDIGLHRSALMSAVMHRDQPGR